MTVNPTVALVLPLAFDVTVSQPLSLEDVHPHPESVWSATTSDPPAYPIPAVELLSAYRHGAAASTSCTL